MKKEAKNIVKHTYDKVETCTGYLSELFEFGEQLTETERMAIMEVKNLLSKAAFILHKLKK